MKFPRHRIADERVLRLIGRWLAAGVIEDGAWTASEQGSPQGASVPPLLANVYLHYVLDLWADWWRKRLAPGDVIIVRFADDFIVGFEEREDAERFLAEMRERFAKFSLELHPGKTRLIEFRRHAARRRAARGEGKPETFAFLGFTHICATSRRGRFWVRRKTDSKRMRAKLKMVKDRCPGLAYRAGRSSRCLLQWSARACYLSSQASGLSGMTSTPTAPCRDRTSGPGDEIQCAAIRT